MGCVFGCVGGNGGWNGWEGIEALPCAPRSLHGALLETEQSDGELVRDYCSLEVVEAIAR